MKKYILLIILALTPSIATAQIGYYGTGRTSFPSITTTSTLGPELAPALTAANWTCGAGWTCDGGTLVKASGLGIATTTNALALSEGSVYRVTVSVTGLSGSERARVYQCQEADSFFCDFGFPASDQTADGTYSADTIAIDGSVLFAVDGYSESDAFTITSLSIRQVIGGNATIAGNVNVGGSITTPRVEVGDGSQMFPSLGTNQLDYTGLYMRDGDWIREATLNFGDTFTAPSSYISGFDYRDDTEKWSIQQSIGKVGEAGWWEYSSDVYTKSKLTESTAGMEAYATDDTSRVIVGVVPGTRTGTVTIKSDIGYPVTTRSQIALTSNATDSTIAITSTEPTTGTSTLTITPAEMTFTKPIVNSYTGSLGWSIKSGANTACTTTCTAAAVMGFNTASGTVPVGPADATADICLCAGSN